MLFHPGEIEAQARAGVILRHAPIRDFMPDQHRQFFAGLPLIFAAFADDAGWPVATALAGPPGFITSPDPSTLELSAVPGPDDPGAAGLRPGAPIGLLGIDLATRRRNRANGILRAVTRGGFAVAVRQSFGNCPQYIQARKVLRQVPQQAGRAEHFTTLDARARASIVAADTFFVASGSGGRGGEAGGLDVSHRGGRPGFVRVEGDLLTIPDFRGNHYYNTLGNLLLDPRAGLLFVDFTTGDLLHLQGLAELLWNDAETQDIAGAERLWRLRVTGVCRRPAALPLRWTFVDYAPTTLRTGIWPQRVAA